MRLKKTLLFVLVLLISVSSFCVPASADTSIKYDAIRIGIPVSGTGTFHMRVDDSRFTEETENIRVAAHLSIGNQEQSLTLAANGFGFFYVEVEEPGDYYYEMYSNDKINDKVYEIHLYVTTMIESGEEALFASISIFPKLANPMGEERIEKQNCAYYPLLAINPPIKKTVTGAAAPADAEFKFEFRAISTSVDILRGDMPMPSGSDGQVKHLSAKGGEKVEAGNIWISVPGTYVYELLEVDTGLAGFTYDKSRYLITFVIEEGEKGLEATKRVTKDNNEYNREVLEIVNQYGGQTTPPGKGTPKTGDSSGLYWWTVLCAATGIFGPAVAYSLLRSRMVSRRE